MIGAIIKKHRLEKNYSQSTLCEGICAVSYLSKIESGSVKANDEIINLLLERLGIAISLTLHDQDHLEKLIEDAYQADYFGRHEDFIKILDDINLAKDYLPNSPLAIDYHLLSARVGYTKRSMDQMNQHLATLESYLPFFSNAQSHYYYCLRGMIKSNAQGVKESLNHFTKAYTYERNGLILLQLQKTEFLLGNYIKSIKYGNEAYDMLTKEGNLHYSLESSQLQAAAYANANQIEVSVEHYHRLLEMGYYLEKDHVISSAYYNIGATYLASKDYQKAKHYFTKLLPYLSLDDPWNWLIAYQKFVLCEIGLGNFEQARRYLKTMKDNIENQPKPMDETLLQSIKWLSYFEKTDHPYQDPAYLDAIRKTYESSLNGSHHGFKLFYSTYLVEALKAQRKYKEALDIQEHMRQ